MPELPPVQMVKLPGSEFTMGFDYGDPDERPTVSVVLSNYEMDVTEVTVSAFAACVRAGKCTAAARETGCNAEDPRRASDPVNCVDYDQAAAYCTSVGKRLPTEAEWEFAARGFDRNRMFPWGLDKPDAQVCWKRSAEQGTCPVGSYPTNASRFGLLDLAGNVWEWTSSCYCAYDDYAKCQKENRKSCTRVTRGGSWADTNPGQLRVTNRPGTLGEARPTQQKVGFRCVR